MYPGHKKNSLFHIDTIDFNKETCVFQIRYSYQDKGDFRTFLGFGDFMVKPPLNLPRQGRLFSPPYRGGLGGA